MKVAKWAAAGLFRAVTVGLAFAAVKLAPEGGEFLITVGATMAIFVVCDTTANWWRGA